MPSKLQEEIKQAKPFGSMKAEVWLNLCRTAALLGHQSEQHLKPYGLSPTQYNVLRILRGAGEAGLCQYEIRDRLVAQVPDVPRILDRMEAAGWVRRERSASDRRVVMATLTCSGLDLVNRLDAPMAVLMEDLFRTMSEEQMQQLNGLLVAARE